MCQQAVLSPEHTVTKIRDQSGETKSALLSQQSWVSFLNKSLMLDVVVNASNLRRHREGRGGETLEGSSDHMESYSLPDFHILRSTARNPRTVSQRQRDSPLSRRAGSC